MASSPRLQKPRRKWRGDHLRNRRAFFGGVFDLAAISGDTSGSCAPSGGTATGALVASEDFRAGTSLSRYGSLAIDADGNWTYTSSTSLVGVSDTIAVATVDGRRAVISILVRGRLFYEVSAADWPLWAPDFAGLTATRGTASLETFGLDLTGVVKANGGAVLAPNGKIYAVPNVLANIMIYDTVGASASLSTMGASLADSAKWTGGVLAPNGKIYGMPASATDILIIDPVAGTATRSDMGATLTGASKFLGGVLGPDGKIYGIPQNSQKILIIDPDAGTATLSDFGLTIEATAKWAGGVLGPDGKIYGIPSSSTDILIIDPLAGTATRSAMGATLTGTTKWQYGALGKDGKIYGAPRNSVNVLIIDPLAGTATRSTMGATLSGSNAYSGAGLGGDGKLYLGPAGSGGTIGIIDTDAGTLTQSNLGLTLDTPAPYFGNPALGPDGNLYFFPTSATHFVKIPFTGAAPRNDFLLSAYRNKP
jgi:hypothetical protein